MNLEVRQAKEIEAMAKEFNRRSKMNFDVNKVLQAFDKIMGDYDHDIFQPKYDFETETHKQERYYDKAVRSYGAYYKTGLVDIIKESTKEALNKTNISIHSLELYDDFMSKSFEILFPAMDEDKYAMGGMTIDEYENVYFKNIKTTKSTELLDSHKKAGTYTASDLSNELLWKNEEISSNPKASLKTYKDLASLYVISSEKYEKKGFFSKYFTKEGWALHHELYVSRSILTYKAKDLGMTFEDALVQMNMTNPSSVGLNTYHSLQNVLSRFTDKSYMNEENEMTKARDKAEKTYYDHAFPKKEKEEAIVSENKISLNTSLEIISEEDEVVPFDAASLSNDVTEYALA